MLRFCILLFIFQITVSYGFQPHRGNCKNYPSHTKENGFVIVGYDYKEQDEDIWRPCCLTDVNLKDCIRDFFMSYSDCIPSYGPVSDPLSEPIEKFFFPVSCMTATHVNAEIRGLKDACVEEFYVNKATGNVVMALDVPNFNFSSYSWFSYQRYARESIALDDFSTFAINLKLTAIIPKIPYLRLGLAEIHATTPNKPPKHYIGIGNYRSDNPTVISEFKSFNENIETVIREVFTFFAPFLMTTYVQTEICNFGIPTKNYNGYNLGKCF